MRRNHLVIVGLFAASLAYAGGREVVVAPRFQANVHGELVMVQDTSLVVAVTLEEQESGGASAETLMVIPLRSIEYVKVTGKSLVRQAAIIGALAGGVFGGIYAASRVDRPSNDGVLFSIDIRGTTTFYSVVGGFMIGLGVGAGIGYALSSEEMYLDPADPGFREILQQAAARQPSN
jgi:hypothetical protein